MTLRRIEGDRDRFRKIVKGAIKTNLKKHITSGSLTGKLGGKTVKIPLPQIQLPKFTYGKNNGGIGAGEKAPGNAAEAGEEEGQHELEVEVSYDELADILGEELELPNLEPKGTQNVDSEKAKFNTIRRVGPEGLRNFRRTYKAALRRTMAAGTFDPNNPIVIPERADRRYKSWSTTPKPIASASLIYMMDVSGSMSDEAKDIVRTMSFWIDLWIRKHYPNIERTFIIHDAVAKEVNEHEFFHTTESGGTKVSSAYKLCADIIDQKYSPEEWNIYPFHFSDGDTWGGSDDTDGTTIIRDRILPKSSQFSYGQVRTAYGHGKLKGILDLAFIGATNYVSAEVAERDEILGAIKTFLGSKK